MILEHPAITEDHGHLQGRINKHVITNNNYLTGKIMGLSFALKCFWAKTKRFWECKNKCFGAQCRH